MGDASAASQLALIRGRGSKAVLLLDGPVAAVGVCSNVVGSGSGPGRFLSRLSRFLDKEQDRIDRKTLALECERDRLAAAAAATGDGDGANAGAASSALAFIGAGGVGSRDSAAGAGVASSLSPRKPHVPRATPLDATVAERIRYIYDVAGFYRVLEGAYLDLFSDRLDVRGATLLEMVKADTSNDDCVRRVGRVSSLARAKEAVDFFADLGIMAEYEEHVHLASSPHHRRHGDPDDDDDNDGNDEDGEDDDDGSDAGQRAMIRGALAGTAADINVTIHVPETLKVASRLLALALWKTELVQRTLQALSPWQLDTWWLMFSHGTATLHRCLSMVLSQPAPVAGLIGASSSPAVPSPRKRRDGRPGGAAGSAAEEAERAAQQAQAQEALAAAMHAHTQRLMQLQRFADDEHSRRARVVAAEVAQRAFVHDAAADHSGFIRALSPQWAAVAVAAHQQQLRDARIAEQERLQRLAALVTALEAGELAGRRTTDEHQRLAREAVMRQRHVALLVAKAMGDEQAGRRAADEQQQLAREAVMRQRHVALLVAKSRSEEEVGRLQIANEAEAAHAAAVLAAAQQKQNAMTAAATAAVVKASTSNAPAPNSPPQPVDAATSMFDAMLAAVAVSPNAAPGAVMLEAMLVAPAARMQRVTSAGVVAAAPVVASLSASNEEDADYLRRAFVQGVGLQQEVVKRLALHDARAANVAQIARWMMMANPMRSGGVSATTGASPQFFSAFDDGSASPSASSPMASPRGGGAPRAATPAAARAVADTELIMLRQEMLFHSVERQEAESRAAVASEASWAPVEALVVAALASCRVIDSPLSRK